MKPIDADLYEITIERYSDLIRHQPYPIYLLAGDLSEVVLAIKELEKDNDWLENCVIKEIKLLSHSLFYDARQNNVMEHNARHSEP